MTNADAKKQSMQRKRQNAYDNSKKELIKAIESNYDTCVNPNITIIMEDDGYAFDYIKRLLERTYNFLNIELIGAHGEGCVHHLISYVNTDFLLLIYDKSNNIALLNNIEKEIKEFQARNSHAKVVKIMPKAFEEVILSYIDIQRLIQSTNAVGIQLLNTIKDYVTGKIHDYSLTNYVINANRINDDMILEDWIDCLTHNTNYYCSHSPSRISNCWLDDCCTCSNSQNTCITVNPVQIDNYTPKSKIEYMALNSLASYIIKAIDNYLGHNFRKTNCKLLDDSTIMMEV